MTPNQTSKAEMNMAFQN